MVYMKADAEQYNYKMYRWRSTYLAAANNYKQLDGLFYGVEWSPGSSRHELFVAVVCKMEITSRECYSFCVISFRVLGMSRSLSSIRQMR